MRRIFPLTIFLLVAVFFSTTGFQCGSAELTSAKLYINQKQFDKAEASLVKELQKNDKDEEAWFLLGQVRMEMKKYNEMLDAYKKAAEISDTHKSDINRNRLAVWAMMYNEGVKNYNNGKDSVGAYDKALDQFKTAIAMEPDSSGTYYVAAMAYFAKKDYPTSSQMLQTALEKKPDFGDAARFLGQVEYQMAAERQSANDEAGAQQQFGVAMKGFEVAYKANPNDAENITNLIDVYERTKNTDKALELTSSAVKKDPNNKTFRYAYGVFLLKQEKYQEAIEQFDAAVKIDPSYADAKYNLGVSYLNWGVKQKEEGDKKAEAEAAASGKKGKGKDIKVDESYKDKFKQALPYLEESVQSRPNDAGLWQSLGRLYAILNMSDKSKVAFEKFDSLSKNK
jgi:tetratricopeptide (TPR) repeat protein